MLSVTVVPMIKSLWETLTAILKTRFNEGELIAATCDLLRTEIDIVIKSKDLQLEEMFSSLAKNLLFCFQSSHKNTCCLRTVAHAVQLMGRVTENL